MLNKTAIGPCDECWQSETAVDAKWTRNIRRSHAVCRGGRQPSAKGQHSRNKAPCSRKPQQTRGGHAHAARIRVQQCSGYSNLVSVVASLSKC